MDKKITWNTKSVAEVRKKLEDGYILKTYEIPFFEKRPGLRRAGVSFGFTPHEVDEYIKCKEDIKYFIEEYCFIKIEDGSYDIMFLRDYQHEIMDLYLNNKYSILMASRQIGKCSEYNTPLVIYNKNSNEFKEIKFFQLLFKIKKDKTIYDYIKYGLYTLINIIGG